MFSVAEKKMVESLVDIMEAISLEGIAQAHLLNVEAEKNIAITKHVELNFNTIITAQKHMSDIMEINIKKELLLQFKLEDILNYYKDNIMLKQGNYSIISNSNSGNKARDDPGADQKKESFEKELNMNSNYIILNAYICKNQEILKNNYLSYYLKSEDKKMSLKFKAKNFKEIMYNKTEEFLSNDARVMLVKGKGEIILNDQLDTGYFKFIVKKRKTRYFFRLQITADNYSEFCHDSGFKEAEINNI